jgi:carboxypeptidase family protein
MRSNSLFRAVVSFEKTEHMRFKTITTILGLFVLAGTFQLWAQTITTGQLSGTVTDPSGAVIANAGVQLKSLDDGSMNNGKTSDQGYYQFAYLKPGNYSVTVSASGFQATEKKVAIPLGASAVVNLQLGLGSSATTIEVTGTAASIETEDANLTANFNAKQIDLLPNPGNDLSAVALTSPGAVMNTAGGSQFGGGNFEVNGLPATSNLFTLDGSNDNDPYFNVNNSGATNLSLGLNDIQESTVVANGYSGSYGGLAGANVNYVSKSGSNAFHGNAVYWWNGNILNANNYFRDQQNALAGKDVAPRPFVNANQFAGSVGGPIKKDKAFFFFDVEGLQLAIPSPQSVNVPTTAFENAVLANLNANNLSASVPFYTTAFGLWNRVPQGGAKQVPGGGCSDVTRLAGVAFGTANPCAVNVQAALSAHTHDTLYVGKVDVNLTNNDKLFVRVEKEHGLQASYTDGISSAFNAVSDQPQWQSQVGETHTFGSNKVNDFKASLIWYSAGFAMQNPKAAASALPFPGVNGSATLAFGDGSLGALNALGFIFPQGRNITQYQFVDDFSWVRGRHDFKLGINFRRDDISDQNFTITTPLLEPFTLGNFANGGFVAPGAPPGNIIVQNFPSHSEVPIALYQLGFYGSDDVRVTNNLKLTFSLRFDHLSNPVCQTNCFQRLVPGAFGNSSAPVNTAIQSGLHTAFPSVTKLAVQPKIGFAWSPRGSQKTVLRGGIGMFADALPTGAIDNFLQNAPLDPGFNTLNGFISPAQTGTPYGTCAANCTLNQLSLASNASFQANYASGGTVNPFNFYNATAVKVPLYYKWSLEVQQAVGWKTTLNLLYVGNHGSHEEISNGALNAFSPTRFANFPTAAPDLRFGQVSDARNIANSNYHGLTLTANHAFSGGFQFQASYTFSHALDEISNNSLSPFGLNTTGQYADVIYPQNPANIRQYNYGNADYDLRHNFTMNYVWDDAFRHITHWGPNALVKGWTFSGTIFRHSGLPFTVFSSNVTSALQANNFGGGSQYIFSDVVGPTTGSCGASAVSNPCLSAANFPDPTTTFGNQKRNQYRGPGYFNTDFAIEKGFGIPKWEHAQFSLGARFFNIFNHPNFYFPIMNRDNTQFGTIISTVSSPTSIYGSGLGADASPRVIQLQAKFTF